LENFRQALAILSDEYEHPELVETLEWLAISCADLGQWIVATHFIAAADSLRQISGIVPPVPYRQHWGTTKDRAKENISESEYKIAWDEATKIEQVSLPEYAFGKIASLSMGS